jgi:hypothetical protein
MRTWWLLVVAGCATESWYELGADPNPTAVGATFFAGVSSGNCREGDRAAHCSFDTVTIESLTLSTPGVFDVDPASPVAIALIAVGEGSTQMTIEADNGDETKTFVRVLTTLAADRVTVTPTRRDEPCSLPARFGVGLRPTLPVEKYRGDTLLHGRYYNPFELTGGGTIDRDRSRDGDLVLALPDVPASFTMTSPVDPSFSLALETFAPAQAESIVLGDTPAQWFPLTPARVSVDLIVGGQPACGDSLPRTVTTEGVCVINEEDGTGTVTTQTVAGLDEVLLRAYQAGTCTVRVDLDGTSVTAMKSFTVFTM